MDEGLKATEVLQKDWWRFMAADLKLKFFFQNGWQEGIEILGRLAQNERSEEYLMSMEPSISPRD